MGCNHDRRWEVTITRDDGEEDHEPETEWLCGTCAGARILQLERQLAKAREMIEEAYNDGYKDCSNDCVHRFEIDNYDDAIEAEGREG